MKTFYKIIADVIFLIHLVVVITVVFGWMWPQFWPWYMALLIVTVIIDLTLQFCILSKWEFDLRKKHNPAVEYNYTWTTFYTHRLTKHHISDIFFLRSATFFLIASLCINIYFHYFFN